MFDIGWSELLVVGVVALIVVGPKELPGLLRSLGKALAGVRRMAGDFQSQFNEAMREAELDELKKEVDALRSHASGYLNIPNTAQNEIRNAIQGSAPTTTPAAAAALESAGTGSVEPVSAAASDAATAAALEAPPAGPETPSAEEAPVPGATPAPEPVNEPDGFAPPPKDIEAATDAADRADAIAHAPKTDTPSPSKADLT